MGPRRAISRTTRAHGRIVTHLGQPPDVRVSPILVRILAPVFALAVPAGAARAAEVPATSALEAGPFRRATAVLVVQVLEVTDVRAPGGALGQQVVRARVLESFKGAAEASADVSILVTGQRPTLDPQRPSVPYFRKGRNERYVVFLGRAPGRYAWQLQTLYEAEGLVGAEKIAAVKAVATWAALGDLDAKASQTLRSLLPMLASRGSWLRPHAARELAYLAQVRPQVFESRTLGQLNRVAAVGADEDVRFWLQRAMQTVQQSGAASRARTPTPADADPWREAFEAAPTAEDRRQLLARLLDSGWKGFESQAWWAWVRLEPSGRLWLLDALVTKRLAGSVTGLRSAYGSAESGSVREGIVRAVGLLGAPGDVAWLAERLESPTTRRAALIALARVHSDEALDHLRRARQASTGDEARWIDHLLSPAFLAGEAR